MKKTVRMMFKDIQPMAIFSYHGRNYIKIGNSHSVGCRDGKDHIFSLKDRVEVRGRARACTV